MLKTLIVLPDGTELFSGAGTVNAIQSATITECVNGAQELTLGSTCANMVEAKIITPKGGLAVAAGDELTVYKVDDAGNRHKVGLFTTEKPTRPSAHSMSITAYDRITWLDKDLSLWLFNLKAWPYSLYDFAVMVCQECGLVLKNTEIPNGSYMIPAFSGDGITGRQLMQWIGQVAGRFCRATADGEIEFAWYTPAEGCAIAASKLQSSSVVPEYESGNLSIQSDAVVVEADGQGNVAITSELISVTDDGQGNVRIVLLDEIETILYYQNGLTFEDYAVAPIQKVQLRQNEEDVGTVYPDIAEAVNTYIITGNYLLTTSTAEALKPVAQTLYEQMKDVSYTPCKVSIPTCLDIHAGNTVRITDRNGKTITAYVMTKTQTGQRDTIECTGSRSRDSSAAVNNQSFAALTGKVLNLRTDVEGIKVENRDMSGKVAKLKLDVDGLLSSVQTQDATVNGIKDNISKLEQSATEISATVKTIQDDGVKKVSTEFGLTVDESAVKIHRSGSEMTNKLNEQGMYVVRGEGTSAETVMLQADADGVIATDVSVRNYLEVGDHARFEDYNDGEDSERTACFWL